MPVAGALADSLKLILFSVMAGLVPRLSGSILMDKVHGIDSSANQAFGDVLGHGEKQSHAAPQ